MTNLAISSALILFKYTDKGVYNTDVIDTDYTSWLILLHCSDPESEKKFLSTFVLSRTAYIDRTTTEYLREKIGQYKVPMEYLFPVNQTYCFGEAGYEDKSKPITSTTIKTTLTPLATELPDYGTNYENENYANNQEEEANENDEEQ